VSTLSTLITLSSSPAPVLPGFQVGALLGSGGHSTVWQAKAAVDGAPVALKISQARDAVAAARFAHEARMLTEVGPQIGPRVIAWGSLEDGRAYLVLERLAGISLAADMARWRAPPPASALFGLGSALLAAVAALHRCAVVHRDLKPGNVFLESAAAHSVRLIDFGEAFSLSTAAGSPVQVPGAGPVGTPLYMSPEVIAGQAADCRSDVYALGVMLFELATLRTPFMGERRELEYAHLSFRPPPPSRFSPLPASVEAVILRCLAKDPADRYGDAGQLCQAFAAAMAPVPAATGESAATAPPVASTSAMAIVPQRAALLFACQEDADVLELQAAIQPFGGQVAHAAAGRLVCAFTHRAGEHPGQRAEAAARHLITSALIRRIVLDVGSVTARARPGGAELLSSPLFAERARFPSPSDPEGLRITATARDALREEEGRTPDPLFGREAELRQLLDEARRAIDEHRPRAAQVLAEAGLGKSRLARELIHHLGKELPAARVLFLQPGGPLGGGPDEVLAKLLRGSLDLPAERPADGGLELLKGLLGEGGTPELAVAAALVLGWIGPDHRDVQALRAAPGVLRSGAAGAAMIALVRLAAQRPVVVMLDDAQWADNALLDALEGATVYPRPLWICALGRPAFAEARPDWGQRAAHLHDLRLPPLALPSARALCRHLLLPATDIPDLIVERIARRTQGLPLLARELVRCLRREGLLRQSPTGVWYVAGDVLEGVSDSPHFEWLAGRALDGLAPELAAHARLLSLLDHDLAVDEVIGVLAAMPAGLADVFPLDGRVGTERLLQAGLIEEAGPRRFAFCVDLMRAAVARTVSESFAADVHRTALRYYRQAELPEAMRLRRLAWHAAAAGERRDAAAAYLQLAGPARERHQYFEADVLYSRALDQLGDDDDGNGDARLGALKGRGIMRYRLGRYHDSLVDLTQARELAAMRGDSLLQADVMLDESMALDWVHEWQRSRDLAERARELVGDHQDPLLRARMLLAIGRSRCRFSDERTAIANLRAAVELAEAEGDEGYEVVVVADLLLGFILPFCGLIDEAEERLGRVEQLCQAKGDEAHLMAMWNNRSCLWIARNDRARFMEDSSKAMALARRNGGANVERNVNFNAAYFLYWRGEHQAALPHAERAMEIDQRHFRQGELRPETLVLLGRVRWSLGQDVGQLLTELRRHQATARAERRLECLLLPNDELLLDMLILLVDGGGAGAWAALLERAEQVAQGQELLEVLELAGVAALGRGDGPAAAACWQRALAAGERIPNVMMERIRARLAGIRD
jgi:eukaryotic-like serine/threonine-protein kinase